MSKEILQLLAEHKAKIEYNYHDKANFVNHLLKQLKRAINEATDAKTEAQRDILIVSMDGLVRELMFSAAECIAYRSSQFDPELWAMTEKNRKAIKKEAKRYKKAETTQMYQSKPRCKRCRAVTICGPHIPRCTHVPH